MSPETINEVNNEQYQYSCWEREQKNIIIKMSNSQKKQTAWNKLFPPFEPSAIPY